jgi:hypothetical protein
VAWLCHDKPKGEQSLALWSLAAIDWLPRSIRSCLRSTRWLKDHTPFMVHAFQRTCYAFDSLHLVASLQEGRVLPGDVTACARLAQPLSIIE